MGKRLKIVPVGVGGWLRDLPEDPGLIPGTHVAAHSCLSGARGPDILFWFPQVLQAHGTQTHMPAKRPLKNKLTLLKIVLIEFWGIDFSELTLWKLFFANQFSNTQQGRFTFLIVPGVLFGK